MCMYFSDDYYKIISVSIFVLGIYTCGISVLLWWMYKGITECGVSSSEGIMYVYIKCVYLYTHQVKGVYVSITMIYWFYMVRLYYVVLLLTGTIN